METHLSDILERGNSAQKSKMITLDTSEIEYLKRSPVALRDLAEYHMVQETMADGMGMNDSAGYHQAKAEQYLLAATEREAAIERGDD